MRAERHDLREFVRSLTAQQWATESLCSGWSVADLIAHLVAWDALLLYRTRRQHLVAVLRFSALYATSLGSMTLLNRRMQRRVTGVTPDRLREVFGADDGPDLKWLFDGSNPGAHLAEYVIHDQDIRRPLGLPRTIPPDRLAAALDGTINLPGVRLKAWRQLRRHRWQASDLDWCRGRGAVVNSRGEELLMDLAGRPTTSRSH
jgi:uncharacterized protein (TIGR03083 family)